MSMMLLTPACVQAKAQQPTGEEPMQLFLLKKNTSLGQMLSC